MVFSLSSSSSSIAKNPYCNGSYHPYTSIKSIQVGKKLSTKCELQETNSEDNNKKKKLEVGSPIVFIAAPKAIKTSTAIPCLRVNTGLVKPGDVGRIVSRKPKDVWVVRLNIGTYLIDGKYFKALEFDE
ncbi:OLC1v1024800C1 [Oldenlandia corymbosa var. corymbosa]|uniref:OLC1v1024800C1 n=1 Tax=Oldenlandia corymbosa var. corymbosa TaxID=529605 RepID=A0AAV1C383_OLDCO|nr:OLC1v1024800C1 [Oldenlandia corymbosa var. corymbosa]